MNGWNRAKGVPEKAHIAALLQDPARPGVVHLGLSDELGYLYSDDGGRSFRAPGSGPGGGVRSLALCLTMPARLYAAMESNTVMRSSDYGKTWQKPAMRGFSVSKTPVAIQLIADPSDASRLFLLALGTPEALWRSNDGGDSWSRMDRGLSGKPTHPEMVVPPMMAVTRSGVKIALLGGGRIARIGPGEDRWQDATPRAPKPTAEWVTADPRHASRLWRTGQGKLWRSDDGKRWNPVGTFADAAIVNCDTAAPNRLLVVCYSGVFLSTDGGKTRKRVGEKGMLHAVFAKDNLVGADYQAVYWKKR